MKAKCKKNFDDTIHTADLMNTVLSINKWKKLPETLPDWLVETILITEGTCGVTEINGKLYTGTGGYCGNVVNFVPTDYQITNVGVGSKRGVVGEDFVVGWNNVTRTPDWYLMQISNILTEIDVSERCNVLFSRLLRIPKVQDTKEKAAVESAVKALLEGKFQAVTSDNVLNKMLNGEDNTFLDLADVKDIDKLQYLNQYRDNVVKRFFQYYGQGMQTTAKLAQQTTDELHGNDTVSMIHVLDRLEQRKKFAEAINKKWGTEITVELSDCWKDSFEEMEELNKDGSPEQNGDDTDEKETETDNDT